MADKYHRLVTFVVDICTSVLCEVFLYCARKDTTVPGGYLTTNSYMLAKQQSVDNLVKCKAIRKDQYKKLYPNPGTCSETDWDISLLMALLLGLFGARLSNEKNHLYKIRDIRNVLLHESGTARVSDTDFNTMWGDLKHATLTIARRTKGAQYETEVNEKISEASTTYMAGLGETLRLWHKSDSEEQAAIIRQLNETVGSLQKKIDTIEQSSSSACSMIKRGSVLCQDSTGKPIKKFKTVDAILDRLKGNFQIAMATDLYEEFTAPKEIAEIRNKLRTKHRAVLTGCRGSAYFQTALYVIKGMDYNLDKCVLLTNANEWIHIDPDEIDVVLFKHPIGETSIDKAKLSAMVDISQSIIKSTNNTATCKRVVVITVLRADIYKEAKVLIGNDHELFEDTIELYENNTAENPEDLVTDTMALDKQGAAEQPIKTLVEMTEVYITEIECARCNETVLQDAKEKMRKHKAIVLTGPSILVTNSVLTELVKSYSPNARLLLTNPDDLRYVQLNQISLLVIESMSGKYRYDKTKAHRWFESLDMLLALVKNRKLNIIITAEKEGFKRCLSEYGKHTLLQHVVDLDNSSISRVVKQDSADKTVNESSQIPTNVSVQNNTTTTDAYCIGNTLQPSRSQNDRTGERVSTSQTGTVHVDEVTAHNMTSQTNVDTTHAITPMLQNPAFMAMGKTNVPPQQHYQVQSHLIPSSASILTSHPEHRGTELKSFPTLQPAHTQYPPVSQIQAYTNTPQTQPGVTQAAGDVYMQQYRNSPVITTISSNSASHANTWPSSMPTSYNVSPENPYNQHLLRLPVATVAQSDAIPALRTSVPPSSSTIHVPQIRQPAPNATPIKNPKSSHIPSVPRKRTIGGTRLSSTDAPMSQFDPSRLVMSVADDVGCRYTLPMKNSELVGVVPSVSDTSHKLSFIADIGHTQDNSVDNIHLTLVAYKYLVAITGSCVTQTLHCFNLNTLSSISEYKPISHCCGITTVGSDQVAVTLAYKGPIQFIHINHAGHMSYVRDIQAGKDCSGIVYNASSNTLIVSYIDNIQIMDMSGTVLSTFRYDNTLSQCFPLTSYIALSRDNTSIYVTGGFNNTITVMTLTGHVTNVVKDKHMLGLHGVTVGDDGSVYVCSRYFNTVCRLNPHSGTLTTLLDKSDGMNYPGSVVFCERNKKLYVGMRGKIKMYQVNY